MTRWHRLQLIFLSDNDESQVRVALRGQKKGQIAEEGPLFCLEIQTQAEQPTMSEMNAPELLVLGSHSVNTTDIASKVAE